MMKAARIESGVPSVVDVGEPAGASDGGAVPGGVVVDVVSASICGSDLHMIEAGILEGRIPGHELAGIAQNGKPVAIDPSLGCGECEPCTNTIAAHCRAGYGGIGVTVDGGLAQKVVVPEQNLIELPSGLDPAVACLVEPVAVAVRAVNKAALQNASDLRCAVIGGGAIGLATVAVLASRGAEAHLDARHDHQRSAGARLGAQGIASGGYGVVVDAAGTPSSVERAVSLVRPGGRIVLVGTPWDPVELSMAFAMKELTIVSSMTYGIENGLREFADAARVVASNGEIARALITTRLPLDAAPEAFELAGQRRGGQIKVVVEP